MAKSPIITGFSHQLLLTAMFASATVAASFAPNNLIGAIRALAMDAVEKAKSGHPGAPMGMADIQFLVFTRVF